jgi:PAS domain S-box-containing protein
MNKNKGFLEESLADSQGKDVCRALFDGSPDAIFLADPKTGLIIDANPAASELLRRPLHEIIGLHQKDLHPPKREDASRRIFEEHSTSDGRVLSSGPEEHYALRSDGAEIPIEITAKIIKIKGRRVLQGFFRDVAARKAAERALLESEERYRTLVNHAPVGIVVHRLGILKFVNRKMADIAGIADTAWFNGRNMMEFIHPDSRDLVRERVGKIMEHAAPVPPAELKLLAPGGKVVEIEINSILISFQGEDCIMSIIEDITDRKKAKQALQEANAKLVGLNSQLEGRVARRTSQLEELNKELEAFSYSAAHDLKAPLRRISVFSEMLEKEAGTVLAKDSRDYLVNIHKSVTQMTRLVDSLLTLSTTGRKPLALEPVCLGALLREAAEEVAAANPGRDIAWKLCDLPETRCDRGMLKQVLINLLNNAAKYTRGASPASIEVSCETRGGEHVIKVRDNGIGFSMEYADRVFGVFQRLHRSEEFEGAGIGLSTVKRIISRHGGRVWAESEPGKGAAFYFTLPAK